ncbi:GGDEF domain-containing protein [Glaciecola siphonariae]|uniref:diguanylate cyclase n=1 Tax=Glaciecola siphonariae TaxID=521012 RepID=A0ABV9LYU7_9ALTE
MKTAKAHLSSNFFEISDLIASVSDAVAIVDYDGFMLSQNDHFDNLPKTLQDSLVRSLRHRENDNTNYLVMGYQVKLVDLEIATALIVEPYNGHLISSNLPIAQLTRDFEDRDDIFQIVAHAIQESLAWKWVAITRFIEKERLEVLTFLQNGKKLENYQYDIVGTPCKTVIDTVKFTFFESVVSVFPNYKALQDLGVATYAGLVFKNAAGKPIGHVMAMHDTDHVNYAHAQHVFEVATLTLAAHFKLNDINKRLQDAKHLALTDKLTNIGNRLAFDTKLETIASTYNRRSSDDYTLAMIDLDNLKPLNDTRGHEAGDIFIRLMAKELTYLGRESDEVYRIGGDEFALVFSQNVRSSMPSILKRFADIQTRVSANLGFEIGASLGFASLSEVDGDMKAWTKLADARMYEKKKLREKRLS